MKKESQGYMYNIKTKSITFLNRVPLSISYMKVKYIVHVYMFMTGADCGYNWFKNNQLLSQLTQCAEP